MGVSILDQQFNGNLILSVQIAFGASIAEVFITQDFSTWSWTDVSSDVQVDNGKNISITAGRADEASTAQPAVCTFTLDNRQNLYSSSPLSPNWPNVVHNTPVQIVVDHTGGTTGSVRFKGFATSFTPVWDSTGNYAVTQVTCNGVLHRLNQGTQPLQSVLRRSIPSLSNLQAYWPLEDGSAAVSIASAFPGGQPMGIAGTPQLASNTAFDASSALPVMQSGYFFGPVTPFTSSSVQVQFLVDWPAAGSAMADQTSLLRIFTTGTIARWEFQYGTGGTCYLKAIDFTGAQVFSSGAIPFSVDGTANLMTIQLTQSGSNISATLLNLTVGSGTVVTSGALTVTGQTLSGCIAVSVNPPPTSSINVAVGHLSVRSIIDAISSDLLSLLNAYDGELPYHRVERLCFENSVLYDVIFNTVDSDDLSPAMGTQRVDTLINLLREIEATDHGLLCDGLFFGVSYFEGAYPEDQPLGSFLTLDATGDDITPPFAPIDDDQALRNQWQVTNREGSTITASQTDGPLGTDAVGIYGSTATINAQDDQYTTQSANWLVHTGTVEGYRYPTVSFALHRSPDLLDTWINANPDIANYTPLWLRLDIINLPVALTQMPPGTQSLLIQGYTETIDKFTWDVVANCSLYEPYRIARLAHTTSDADEFLCHLESDGSTITPATVLNSNTTFESSVSPWTATSGGTLTQSTTHAHTGTHSARMAPTGGLPTLGIQSEIFSGITAGNSYNAFFWVFPPGNGYRATVQATWINSGGFAFDTSVSSAVAVAAGTWVMNSAFFTAPAGAVKAVMLIQVSAPPGSTIASGAFFYFDDCTFQGNGGGGAAGSTSLSVTTPSGPLWKTGSGDDFPIDLNVDGIKVTCTSISGSSSPQTFIVTGSTVTKAITDGRPVTIWEEAVLGYGTEF